MSLKISYSKLEPNLSGANELKQYRVTFQYVIGHLIMRSRKVWKAWWDQVLKCSYHFVIWLAHWHQCCQAACQFSAQLDNSKSRSFETSWDHKTSYQILKQGPGCFNSASRKIRTSWHLQLQFTITSKAKLHVELAYYVKLGNTYKRALLLRYIILLYTLIYVTVLKSGVTPIKIILSHFFVCRRGCYV